MMQSLRNTQPFRRPVNQSNGAKINAESMKPQRQSLLRQSFLKPMRRRRATPPDEWEETDAISCTTGSRSMLHCHVSEHQLLDDCCNSEHSEAVEPLANDDAPATLNSQQQQAMFGETMLLVVFRIVTFPVGVLFLFASRDVRVQIMEHILQEHKGVARVLQILLGWLCEPYIVFRDHLEADLNPMSFHLDRKAAYGSTFVIGKTVGMTNYDVVRAHVAETLLHDGYFLNAGAGGLKKERIKFIKSQLFRPSILLSINKTDDIFEQDASIRTGTFDLEKMMLTMTRILFKIVLHVDLNQEQVNLMASSNTCYMPRSIRTLLRSIGRTANIEGMKEFFNTIPTIKTAMESLKKWNEETDADEYPVDVFLADVIRIFQDAAASAAQQLEQIAAFLRENPKHAARIRDDYTHYRIPRKITYQSLRKLESTNAILWEIIRLRPVPEQVTRVSETAFTCQLRGSSRTFPAGTMVAYSIQAANRDPKAFPDPEQIKFHRSVEGYVNFNGLGAQRLCLGAHFGFILLKMFAVKYASALKSDGDNSQ